MNTEDIVKRSKNLINDFEHAMEHKPTRDKLIKKTLIIGVPTILGLLILKKAMKKPPASQLPQWIMVSMAIAALLKERAERKR